jgi:hypothetical protein
MHTSWLAILAAWLLMQGCNAISRAVNQQAAAYVGKQLQYQLDASDSQGTSRLIISNSTTLYKTRAATRRVTVSNLAAVCSKDPSTTYVGPALAVY